MKIVEEFHFLDFDSKESETNRFYNASHPSFESWTNLETRVLGKVGRAAWDRTTSEGKGNRIVSFVLGGTRRVVVEGEGWWWRWWWSWGWKRQTRLAGWPVRGNFPHLLPNNSHGNEVMATVSAR